MLYRFLTPSRLRAFEADGGANATAGTSPAGETNGNATGQETANGGTEKKLTLSELLKQHGLQGEFDSVITARLAREEQKRTEAAEKAAKAAQEKTLQEQGEFKTLAETRAAELAAATAKLEAAASDKKTAERYQAALKTHVEALLKDVPAHITSLLSKLDPAEQLEWITANRDALKGGEGQQQTQQRGRGTPGAQGQQQRREAAQGQQQQQPAQPRRTTL